MRITRKGYIDEELLQYPMLQSPHFQTTVNKLAKADITSYSKLIQIVSDESAEADVRAMACWTVSTVWKAINKRHVVTPLLRAAHSPVENVRSVAVHSLSMLNSTRATPFIVDLACDKKESSSVRTLAIQGLSTNKDSHYFKRLRAIIFDETDDIRSRSEALEWLNYPPKVNPVNDFIQLLQHPLPDLRFWAAYRLSQEHRNISKGLSILDEIVAFDRQLPKTWGWHIDREAFISLEGIYWRMLTASRRYWAHPPMYLISPAPEYATFIREYRTYSSDGFYGNLPTPDIDLKIDPVWLSERLVEQWSNIEIDIREPKPKAYLLDWKIKIGRQTFIGGLHRDQYGVVLAGNKKAILEFAVWYRSIISNDQSLFIYEWADPGYELKQGETTQDIEVGLNSFYNKL